MRILIAPNAFKGSLSAPLVAATIARGLQRSGLDGEWDLLPIADGGDDTLEVLVAQGGALHEVLVEDPLGRPMTAGWGLLADGSTAVVEMARASGLKLLRPEERDPLRASTYGTGQLISAAVRAGCTRIIVGVGGSATVDGGAGCMQALGVRLRDDYDREIPRGNRGLPFVRAIDVSGMPSRLLAGKVEVLVACDVDNPTLGPNGAAAVFGPQKGATPDDVPVLEANLRHFFSLVRDQLGVNVLTLPGGGAAGALAAGLAAFLGAALRSGVELILDALRFNERLAGADLVITGEGRMDAQTLGGKGPMGVLRAAQKQAVPVIALAGGVGDEDALLEAGFAAVVPVVPGPMTLGEALDEAEALLERAALRVGRLLLAGRGM